MPINLPGLTGVRGYIPPGDPAFRTPEAQRFGDSLRRAYGTVIGGKTVGQRLAGASRALGPGGGARMNALMRQAVTPGTPGLPQPTFSALAERRPKQNPALQSNSSWRPT